MDGACSSVGLEVLEAVPLGSGMQHGTLFACRPLWLRMEWNVINVEELLVFAEKQQAMRGLRVEVPEVRPIYAYAPGGAMHQEEHQVEQRR